MEALLFLSFIFDTKTQVTKEKLESIKIKKKICASKDIQE